MAKIKGWIESKLSLLVIIFIIMHPLLDVLSYFLAEMGDNTISTLSRFAILAAIALVGFLVSEQKKMFVILYGAIALFWILHCLNCFRLGYKNIVDDTSNYLRIVSLPIYSLSLIAFFKKGKNIRKSICIGFAANLGIIIVCTALPWLSGNPVYTYESLYIGLMGWFNVRSAQSAIIVLIIPISIFFAYRTKNYIVYVMSLLLSMGLMFMTGTKLTYYSILLVCVAFIFLFVINLKEKSIKYSLPLLMVLIAAVAFKSYSPTSVRDSMTANAQNNYQKLVEASVKASAQPAKSNQPRKVYDPIERNRKTIFGVYTDKDVYGRIYKDINDRFGVYNVMTAFDYTTAPSILSDTRERKTYFAKLVWSEKDFLTHLVGFEYEDMIHGSTNYDLENDFPAVFFFCGYIGFALYMLYFIYFVFIVLRAFMRNVNKFLTIEMGVVGMSFILAMGAAQISGNVLRRPNVTGYFAVIAAYIYYLAVMQPIPEGAKSIKEFTADILKKRRERKAAKKKKKAEA